MLKKYKILFLFMGIILNCSFALNAESLLNFSKEMTSVRTELDFNKLQAIQTSPFSYFSEVAQKEEVTRLIFVRHGESNSNKEKSIAGRTFNSDLSELGIVQAQEVGILLNGTPVQIDAVFSSPMKRTTDTANHILSRMDNALELAVTYDARLHEKWYGPYEGATEAEYALVKKREEIDVRSLATFGEKFTYKTHPDMESLHEVSVRVVDFIKAIQKDCANQNILVATHGGTMKSLFMADAAFHGFEIEYRAFELGNCAIVVLEVGSNGDMQIVATTGLKFRHVK